MQTALRCPCKEVQLCYSYRVLCKFINSSGQEYRYQYNENLRLESVTTPRGIVGVKNVYDSANRVRKRHSLPLLPSADHFRYV